MVASEGAIWASIAASENEATKTAKPRAALGYGGFSPLSPLANLTASGVGFSARLTASNELTRKSEEEPPRLSASNAGNRPSQSCGELPHSAVTVFGDLSDLVFIFIQFFFWW